MNRRAAVAAVAGLIAVAGAVGVFGATGHVPSDQSPSSESAEAPAIDHDGEGLTLENDPGQVVSGRTDLAAGAEVVVRLKSNNSASPFIRQQTVAVGENGRFEATFDLSGVPAGTPFHATLRHDGTTLITVPGKVVAGTVDPEQSSDDAAVIEYDGDALTLENDSGQIVSGRTDLAAGSDVVVRLRSSESAQPFLRQTSTTVGENGRFEATFNMTDIKPGVTFTVSVMHDGETIDEAPGEVVDGN